MKSVDAMRDTLLAVLFASNVFFVKNLVDKLESTDASVQLLKIEVSVLTARLGGCGKFRRSAYDKRVREGCFSKAL